MNEDNFQSLKRGLAQAKAHAAGNDGDGYVVHKPGIVVGRGKAVVHAKTKAGAVKVAKRYRIKMAADAAEALHDTFSEYVKHVRAKTKLTQDKFATTYHLEVGTVREWEQGRREPEKAAKALLAAIEREPETVARLLS